MPVAPLPSYDNLKYLQHCQMSPGKKNHQGWELKEPWRHFRDCQGVVLTQWLLRDLRSPQPLRAIVLALLVFSCTRVFLVLIWTEIQYAKLLCYLESHQHFTEHCVPDTAEAVHFFFHLVTALWDGYYYYCHLSQVMNLPWSHKEWQPGSSSYVLAPMLLSVSGGASRAWAGREGTQYQETSQRLHVTMGLLKATGSLTFIYLF